VIVADGRPAPRVLIIGLDLGDGGLIRKWAREGRLPVLASLIEAGQWQWLETTAEALHVSGWPSFYTGAMPGEHGVYYTFQPAPGRQGWFKFEGDQYGRPTFWNVLSRAGVRCTVFDAPYTHPEADSAALQIFDWGTWAHYWRPTSTPPSQLQRLRRACGHYPLGMQAMDVGMTALEPHHMGEQLVVAARAKTEAAQWLMGDRPWDLFFVVYGESHPGGHYCYTPSGHDGVEVGEAQPTLRAVYEEIDRGVGALLERAGDPVSLFVISGDGLGPNHAGWHLLPEVLRRLGYLVEPSASEAPALAEVTKPRDPIRRLRDALPKDFRKALARRLPDALRHRLARRVDTAAIDWSKTKAFCLPTDLEGLVRINLRGREAYGVVEPGEEYRRVCDALVDELEELVEPSTGKPAVQSVIRVEDAFPGPRRHYLPDLIVLWNAESPFSELQSAAIGTVAGPSPDHRPGTHAAPGFLLRHEPRAGSGAPDPNAHVCDFAPEMLRRFGVAVPDYVRGSTGSLLSEGEVS
jgi:predicted AlkP superfamily phosphohydrolase/phosphomutase